MPFFSSQYSAPSPYSQHINLLTICSHPAQNVLAPYPIIATETPSFTRLSVISNEKMEFLISFTHVTENTIHSPSLPQFCALILFLHLFSSPISKYVLACRMLKVIFSFNPDQLFKLSFFSFSENLLKVQNILLLLLAHHSLTTETLEIWFIFGSVLISTDVSYSLTDSSS